MAGGRLNPDDHVVPAVSVVIPTKNRAALLRETLASLAAQTSVDWEAIVVDDVSVDDTEEVVASFVGQQLPVDQVRFVALPERRAGASAARNVGVELARGRYVVFLDSDDLLTPTCIEQRIDFMDSRPDVDFAVSQCGLFRDTIGDTTLAWNRFGDPSGDLDRYLARDPVWQTTGPTWRREALDRIGAWDEQALSGQDWEFSTRALAAGLRHVTLPDLVDCGWRLPSGDRSSIGKAAAVHGTGAAHARSWAGTVVRVWQAVDKAGKMNADRRQLVAGLMWHACRGLGDKASYGEARQYWKRVWREFGLISPRQFAEGWAFHKSGRREWFNRLKLDRVEFSWPPAFRRAFHGSRTHCRVHVEQDTPPLVSVLLPARNAGRYVDQAVRSVLNQTFRDFELLIVDDGSTDDTGRRLELLASDDVRIKLTHRPRNAEGGLVASLNDMATRARGRLLARMDADDICHPERLEKQVARIRRDPSLVALGGQVRWVDPLGHPYASSSFPTTHDAIDADLLAGRGGTLPHPATIMRREAFDAVGGYRGWAYPSEDLDLWLRLAEFGRVANLDDVVLDYRQHFDSITRTQRDRQLAVKPRIVNEAYERRALGESDPDALDGWLPEPEDKLLCEWGWRALKDGRVDAARVHAMGLVRRQPLRSSSWRLLASAVRGR